MREWRTFVPLGRYLIDMGYNRRLTFWFLSYFTNKYYLHNCLWEPFRSSPMLFGMIVLSEIITSICETTGMILSNMEQISSISVLWYLFLIHRLILAVYFPHLFWRVWISSSAPWAVVGCSMLIAITHTILLACIIISLSSG